MSPGIFEKVAKGELTPEEGADRLIALRTRFFRLGPFFVQGRRGSWCIGVFGWRLFIRDVRQHGLNFSERMALQSHLLIGDTIISWRRGMT